LQLLKKNIQYPTYQNIYNRAVCGHSAFAATRPTCTVGSSNRTTDCVEWNVKPSSTQPPDHGDTIASWQLAGRRRHIQSHAHRHTTFFNA